MSRTLFTTMAVGALALGSLLRAQEQPPPSLIAPEDVTANRVGADQDMGDVEYLARGPVHEAFAARYAAEPEPGPVVQQSPPDLIDELPPDQMPEGENVAWIPGYWDFDDDRNDFIWISGLWRDIPPGQRWIPGSWNQVDGGFQWTSGFWTSASVDRLAYLPEAPPPSQEWGPNVAAPGDDYFWIPGCWHYTTSYQWQPGYWAPVQPDWVWVPSRYYWTPYGYHFANGYWDYPPVNRGVLFAPAFAPGYRFGRFRPAVVVPIAPLMVNLFIRQGRGSYFFGNFYGNSFAGRGFSPWIMGGNRFGGWRGYDPLWNYYRFGRPNQFNQLYGWNRYYQFNDAARPPATFREYRDWRGPGDDRVRNNALLATSWNDITRDQSRRQQLGFANFRTLEDNRRQELTQSVQQMREVQRLRSDRDGRGASPQDGGAANREIRLPQLNDRLAQAARNAAPQQENAQEGGRPGRLPEPPASNRERGRDTTPGQPGVDPGRGRGSDRLEQLLQKEAPLEGEARTQVEQQRRQLDERFQQERQGRVQEGEQRGREQRDPGQRGRDGQRGRPEGANPANPMIPDQPDRNRDGRGPNRPGAEPQTPGNRPEGQQPNRPGSEPGAQPNRPGNQPNQPGAQPNRPGNQPNQPNQPGAQPNRPNPQPNQPGAGPNQPGNQPNQPGAQPNRPGNQPNQPNQPGAQPNRPNPQPNPPGAGPNQPGNQPNQPGAQPNQPGAQPNRPGNQPNQPNQPGAQPNRPGNQPNQPNQPGAQPNRPNAPGAGGNQQNQPGAAPNRPGNQPNAPGAQPNRPNPQPNQPATPPNAGGQRNETGAGVGPGQVPSAPGNRLDGVNRSDRETRRPVSPNPGSPAPGAERQPAPNVNPGPQPGRGNTPSTIPGAQPNRPTPLPGQPGAGSNPSLTPNSGGRDAGRDRGRTPAPNVNPRQPGAAPTGPTAQPQRPQQSAPVQPQASPQSRPTPPQRQPQAAPQPQRPQPQARPQSPAPQPRPQASPAPAGRQNAAPGGNRGGNRSERRGGRN